MTGPDSESGAPGAFVASSASAVRDGSLDPAAVLGLVAAQGDRLWSYAPVEDRVLALHPTEAAAQRSHGMATPRSEGAAGWRDAVHPDDRERFAAALQQVFTGGEAELMYRRVAADGSSRWLHDRMRRVDAADGGVRIVGYARDVTTCKQVEDHAAVQSERMHAIVATVSEGLSVTDERGRCLVFNPQMAAITGYTAADSEDPGLFAQMFPDRHTRARAVAHMQRARRGIDLVNQEWRIVRKDGEPRDVLVSTRILGAPPPHLLMAVRDVTVRRRAEDQRWAVERRLREAERLDSLGVMAGGIAHDFNNLLQTILGFGELAASAVPEDSPAASALAQVQGAGRRAAELTRQMLAYAGRTRFVPRRCELAQVLRRAEPLLAASLRAGLRLELEIGEPAPVDADPAQLRQVLINLVANAGEALTERDGRVVLRAGSQRCDRDYLATCYPDDHLPTGVYAFFEVEDEGCGMNAITRAHLFDPFFSTKFTGRGLGLAAVLGVVRGHRGAVDVRSEPGRGTTIRVLLPAVT